MLLACRKVPPFPQTVVEGVRMSEARYLKWNDEFKHSEWVDGVAILMSPVNADHAALAHFMSRLLSQFVEDDQLGKVFVEPFQIRLGDQRRRRSPDVMVIKRVNLPRLQPLHLDGPADLIVEVISPGTRSIDYREKFFEYEAAGVPEYWILDPTTRDAFAYRNSKARQYTLIEPIDGWIASRVLPRFAFKLSWLEALSLPALTDCLRQIRRRKSR